jgi:type VI secretion system secreted protein Hcp
LTPNRGVRYETMVRTLRPSPLSRTLALVPPAALLAAQHAGAAFDAFIKIGDIKGEVTTKTHLEWIDGYSFQYGVSNQTSFNTGGGGAGKAVASEVVLTKRLDAASPKLFLACAMGTLVPEVKIELVKPDGSGTLRTFYRITLTDVFVSSLSNSGADGDDVVGESVSLNYAKIKVEYYQQDAKGGVSTTPITSGWDFVANQKL